MTHNTTNHEKCECSLSVRLLGDGCPVCNPEYWSGMSEEKDYNEERLREILNDNTRRIVMVRNRFPDSYEERYEDVKTGEAWIRIFPFSHTEYRGAKDNEPIL